MFKLKQMASVAAAVVSLAFGIAPAMAVPTIGFVPVAGGVDVVVSNLGTEIVSAYDVDVSYGAALAFTGFTLSSALGVTTGIDPLAVPFPIVCSTEFCGDALDLGGLVDLWGLSLLSDASLALLQNGGPVTLATLLFTGDDFSSLEFVNWGPFNDVKGRDNGIIIGQIPEPATYGLIGMALLAAGVARRRQA